MPIATRRRVFCAKMIGVNEFLPPLLGIGLLNVYALALILLLAPLFRTHLYRPMLWNMWLSILPALVLFVTLAAIYLTIPVESPLLMWAAILVGGLLWLLMLPNSAYLITELNFSHRHENETVPLWYDIVLVLTLALSGMA